MSGINNHTGGSWRVEKRELATDAGDAYPGSHGSQTHLIWSNAHNFSNWDTSVIAHIVMDGKIDRAEADANARLISLVPELLQIARRLSGSFGASDELRKFLPGWGND